MAEKLLLVDFENVQQVDLAQVGATTRVVIFHGASQKNVPIELVTAAQGLGERVEWIKIQGNGRNALDFHIACYLGRVFERRPDSTCTVLSKDKGFDPLIQYLGLNGLKCKRIDSLPKRLPEPTAALTVQYERVLKVLRKSQKARPRKRKTLAQHISSIFQKKISRVEVDAVMDLLFARKQISEENGAITYRL